ncbi:MAG: hypothetical protein V1773_19015 [bacterium]
MKKLLFVILLSSVVINAQTEKNIFSGSLNFDSQMVLNNLKTDDENKKVNFNTDKKSPLIAGVLSFVVPGAGEFYSENYIMSAIFFAAEAAVITTGLIYDKKGDDQTSWYHNYAQENWDAVRYAKWTITNLTSLNADLHVDDYPGLFYDNGTKVNWGVLNKLETDIGGWYSHKLPAFGEQQYYELIGKYPQFNAGWNDFGDEYTPYKYGDPLTNKFKYYSKERGKANDYYNIASKAVVILIVNHIISAADAAWSANRFNKNLQINVNLQKMNLGLTTEFYPQLNLSYAFN